MGGAADAAAPSPRGGPLPPSGQWCTTAQKLLDLGFSFEKDGYDGEPNEHYSVILGDPPTLEDAERFVSAFTKERRL